MSTRKKEQQPKIKGTISKDVKDYGNDPYFVKKADDSQAFLEKHGFPEEILKRHGKNKSA